MKRKSNGLSVFDRHQKRIAISTLRMSDAGALIMGGPTKAEAREYLRKFYSAEQIGAIENAAVQS